jgi:predicted permease
VKTKPPKLATKLLLRFLRDDLAEEVQGDLEEKFYAIVKNKSLFTAKVNYWYQVLNYIRPFAISKFKLSNTNHYDMFQNYFKVGLRNLLKNKAYSFINVGGLAVGMAVAILIGLWIKYELSFDDFHKNKERIAIVLKHTLFNNEKNTQAAIPLPLYDELKANYPEVKRATRYSWEFDRSLVVGETKLKKMGHFVDPDFLEMFSFPWLQGNIKTALNDPNSIILTQSTATALFGNENPIGKTVRMDNQYDVQITGVIADPPKNSSVRFDFLGPYEFEIQNNQFLQNNRTNWGNNMLMTLVEIKEGVSMEAFSDKIGQLNVEKDNTLKNLTLFLHPLSKWRLKNDYKNWMNTGGRIEYVRLFGIIGIFVLLIACINFMNLSTARSEKRAKEVGIRKVVGSQRNHLITQFLSESILTSFIAFLLSIGLIYLTLPLLNELGFENISFDVTNLSLLLSSLLICLFTGFIAGSYPALYLSSFLPVKVLKRMGYQRKGPVTFRKILVVTQFAISMALIIGTVVVFRQIDHGRSRSLGYNPDNLISIWGSDDLAKNFAPLKQELLNTGYVESVAKASSPMTAVFNSWSDFSWDGKDPNEDIALNAIMTEWDFEKTVGLKIKQGRGFSIEHSTDSNAVLLNEAALKVIGYEDPVGKTMKSGNREITITGIIDDMLIVNPFQPIYPTVILFNANTANVILLRLQKTADLKQALAAIQPVFEKYNPALPFEFSFVDDDFNRKFAMENQVGRLAGIFSGLAIFISCLGLFGLASYIAEQRTKEIGIRKILGASVSNLWGMLSKDFVMLVIVACIIAIPIAYYYMNNWLQKYEYRTEMSWWIFASAGAGVLMITLLTVSFQAIKAAMMNPVNSLRSE